MSDTASTLRAQAERLEAKAAEAERAAREIEEAFAALSPVRQAAFLLHEHFTRTYPGAGGAMDGGDPWYYEGWGGSEHQRFERMAVELSTRWESPMEAVVIRVRQLGEVLSGYTMVSARARSERDAEYKATKDRELAHEALDAAIDAAVHAQPLRGI